VTQVSWAAVFDLDDTLYAYDGFVGSGYRAVGAYLAGTCGAAAAHVVDALWQARARARGREFQALCEAYGWAPELVPQLVDVFRHHQPTIRLEPSAALLLGQLRQRGWRLGVLTNGDPDVQRAKVRALGVESLVDCVVYAEEQAPGGKPAPQAFQAVVTRLGTDPAHTVMVGDDPQTDLGGAQRAGLRAVYVASPSALATVPDMLDALASRSGNTASRGGDSVPSEVVDVQ
jgi:putative hydrolase of the HAD superfamily